MDKHALPLGFGMALAQNELAMKAFEALTETEKHELVEKTHTVNSKREMQQLVSKLEDGSWKKNLGPF